MIVVVFEVWPAQDRTQDYLDLAAALRAELQTIDGFISVERFRSLTEPDKLLSLSFWRDEEAVTQWREHEEHRCLQRVGRDELFADYRLRVVSVMRDYGKSDRAQAPHDSVVVHG